MSIDTFIALLGIFIAVYSLLPRARQLELKLRISKTQIVIGIIIVVLINLLIIIDYGGWAYLITLIFGFYIYNSFRFDSIVPQKIFDLRDLLDELSNEGKFIEVISIFERTFDDIQDIGQNYIKCRKVQQCATNILQRYFNSREFICTIVRIKPQFALTIFNSNNTFIGDFSDLYFEELIKNVESVLYFELREYKRTSFIGPSLPILNYLFNTMDNSNKLWVWRPIGNCVLRYLETKNQAIDLDEYNNRMIDFEEEGKWESILFGAVTFFEVMVLYGIKQKFKFHMWLYYYYHFVERIVNNFSLNRDYYDPYSEWGSKYSYILYVITRNIIKWIEQAKDIGIDEGNIPAASLNVLAMIIREILPSDNIPDVFKRKHFMNLVYYWCFDERGEEMRGEGYLEYFFEKLISFYRFMNEDKDIRFLISLEKYLDNMDRIHYDNVLVDQFKNLITEKTKINT